MVYCDEYCLWAQVAVILKLGLYWIVWDRYMQVLYLGRALRIKETLPNFLKWRRVTRHPLVFHGLMGSQQTPRIRVSQIASLKEEFLTLMPLTSDVRAQQMQIDKFFMVLTLIGLCPDLKTVCDQILSNPSVPSLDDVFAHLLRISSIKTLAFDIISYSFVLVSQTNLRGGRSGN